MAISLSELTGASTSGNVLNEVNSYADFLDSVPRLVNKADPSGNTDAVQTVATKQPIALPLIDGEGYLFCSGINNNYAELDSPVLPATADFDLRIDFIFKGPFLGDRVELFDQYLGTELGRFLISVTNTNKLRVFWGHVGTQEGGVVVEGQRHTARLVRAGSSFTLYLDDTSVATWTSTADIAQPNSKIGFGILQTHRFFKGAIFSVTEGSNFECDFNSPRIPHGATEFTCETGQVVTVNTSGNNPSKVIKKPVLRFDGVNDFLDGVFANNLTSGYMFAAFSVNGDGGDAYGRVFSVHNSTDASPSDVTGKGFIFSVKDWTSNDLTSYYSSPFNFKNDLFDDANGDILHEVRSLSGQHLASVNGTNLVANSRDTSQVDSDIFNISCSANGDNNAAIDLEYLALFPATLTDSQADQIRNFINNRNKVFYRWDTDGYYFFDGAATTDGQVFTGSGSWNGRIVGSDNGDSDFYISQNTLDDRPTTDGYKITFADNTDHFDIPSTSQAGWQIVGTSLGTFAYKVDSDAITELNLLGNAAVGDGFNFRSVGDLYGIILLPESATNRDIEEARKLLIDRGASDGASVSSFYAAWYKRRDVVEFRATMPQATDFRYAWKECTSLTSFSTQLPEVTNAQEAWYNNASLSSFTTTDLKNCSNFSGAWQFCTSLTQFPQDAKLGTEATNVNFTSAWQQSGLQSFSTPLPTASRVDYAWYNDTSLSSFTTTDIKNCSNFQSAWHNCSSLTQFPQDSKLGTETNYVNFNNAWRSSGLTSFPALDLSNGDNFTNAWRDASSLTEISSGLQLGTNPAYTGVSFTRAWQNSGLTSFPALDLSNGNSFDSAWQDCSSLTSFSQDAKLGTEASNVNFTNAWRSSGLESFSTPLPTATSITASWRDCYSLASFDISELPLVVDSRQAFLNCDLSTFSTEIPKSKAFQYCWAGCSSLTDFSADVFANWNPISIYDSVFDLAWGGCSSLTAQSVENILVGISNSGKWATTSGLEGGTALTDATIDIDYNGDPLTAATLTAIETLNGRGWSVNINGVIQ